MSVAANAALTVASAAGAQAAHRERCKGEIVAFDAENATVTEMQSYADCVDLVYPQTMPPGTVWAVKLLIVLALVGLVIGLLKARRDAYNATEFFVFGLLGFLFAPMIGFVLIVLGLSVVFLFS